MNSIASSSLHDRTSSPLTLVVDRASRIDAAAAIRRVQRVHRFAKCMDSRYRIPIIGIRFGFDSVIGLVPGLGDAVTALTATWLLRQAVQLGVPNSVLVKMIANIVIDLSVGVVPVVGDVFDLFWKSNLRNAKLLEEHLLTIDV